MDVARVDGDGHRGRRMREPETIEIEFEGDGGVLAPGEEEGEPFGVRGGLRAHGEGRGGGEGRAETVKLEGVEVEVIGDVLLEGEGRG